MDVEPLGDREYAALRADLRSAMMRRRLIEEEIEHQARRSEAMQRLTLVASVVVLAVSVGLAILSSDTLGALASTALTTLTGFVAIAVASLDRYLHWRARLRQIDSAVIELKSVDSSLQELRNALLHVRSDEAWRQLRGEKLREGGDNPW